MCASNPKVELKGEKPESSVDHEGSKGVSMPDSVLPTSASHRDTEQAV